CRNTGSLDDGNSPMNFSSSCNRALYVRGALQRLDVPHQVVAQVSKPAVSPTSKSATPWRLDGLRIWKSATQQTWKSALLWLRPCRAVPYRGLVIRNRCPLPVGETAGCQPAPQGRFMGSLHSFCARIGTMNLRKLRAARQ